MRISQIFPNGSKLRVEFIFKAFADVLFRSDRPGTVAIERWATKFFEHTAKAARMRHADDALAVK